MKRLFTTMTGILLCGSAVSQCPFDPTVTGDTLLCPNASGLLTTQVYDLYQWYKRPLFGGPSAPIPGANQQTLNIDAANDAGYYFSIQATLNNCTEMSLEVLVDGWVFLQPYTIIEGDYTIGTNGELVVCQGDTVLLICGMPYDTNIQWYDNGNPIPGAINDTLFVTTAGSFTFSGAPSVCPNFTQNQFIPSDVVIITCPTGIGEHPGLELNLVPNPAQNEATLFLKDCRQIRILDARGALVSETATDPHALSHPVNLTQLPRGYYTLCAATPNGTRCTVLVRP
jgi:hypothetical protein